MPSEEYKFLHESAIIEYHGILFAAWYNNKKCELYGETPIRFSKSYDKGQTWSKPCELINDKTGKILYCPPVFGICNDKLYIFINQMVAADHIHSLDLYEYDEKSFKLKWSKPIPFKCNTNVYSLPNGKLILPGRVGEIDEFPNTPAVLISDSGKIDDEWRLVKIQNNCIIAGEEKYIHPEVSLVVYQEKLYAFCRNDANDTAIVYTSDDFGETWSKPFSHNIPLASSKIYSGTLSDGRNYIIGNLDHERRKLAIFSAKIKAWNSQKVLCYKTVSHIILDSAMHGTILQQLNLMENYMLYILLQSMIFLTTGVLLFPSLIYQKFNVLKKRQSLIKELASFWIFNTKRVQNYHRLQGYDSMAPFFCTLFPQYRFDSFKNLFNISSDTLPKFSFDIPFEYKLYKNEPQNASPAPVVSTAVTFSDIE